MALKDKMKSLFSKREAQAPAGRPAERGALLTSESFPMIPASAVDLNRYRKVPLMSLAALGAAFSTLPEAARTITQTVTTRVATDTPIFAGLWPEGVSGRMLDKGLGFSGNITGLDGGGEIVGRMRYKLIDDGLPVTTTTSTAVPFDPMTMIVAAALISIDRKLDSLQQKAEEILQFLKLEKQSKLRGNLNMLAEIMEECSRNILNISRVFREAVLMLSLGNTNGSAFSGALAIYPITCIVFFRYFAGISWCSRHTIFMGLLPWWLT